MHDRGASTSKHAVSDPIKGASRARIRVVPLRVAAISFSNAAPLYWTLQHGEPDPRLEVSYHLPSECARMLERGEVDVATIPAAAYTRIPGLCIVPDIAIASRQAVRSILLVCKVPRHQVRRVALDTSSMTSVALTKVLLSKWEVAVESYASAPPNLDDMLASNDAALLIGDPALQVDRTQFETYDLCGEWVRLTGKSFVFAFWAVRKAAAEGARAAGLVDLLQRSRDQGLRPESLAALAQDWAPRLGSVRVRHTDLFR